jgi:hypothetical protein
MNWTCKISKLNVQSMCWKSNHHHHHHTRFILCMLLSRRNPNSEQVSRNTILTELQIPGDSFNLWSIKLSLIDIWICEECKVVFCSWNQSKSYKAVVARKCFAFHNQWSVCLPQLVKPLAACSLVRLGGPGSIPGVDNLDSGFYPFGVDKMSNSKYVVGWPLQNIVELKSRGC